MRIERKRLTMLTAISQKKVLNMHAASIYQRSLDLIQKLITEEFNALHPLHESESQQRSPETPL